MGHKEKILFGSINTFFDQNGLKINDCRGQSYDNASVMSGQYNGLQALLKKENQLALWLPCSSHSFNLVGIDAMKCCLEVKKFLDFLENLYVFFMY